MPLVVGLDLSLTGSGIARIFTGADGEPYVEHCRLGSEPAGQDVAARSLRLRLLADQVYQRSCTADLLLVESPAYNAKNPGSAHDRSGLWWLVVARLTAHGIPCAEVTSSSLKCYALGKGAGKDTGKDAVLSAVVRRYGLLAPQLQTNDEADALVLAAAAWHRVTGTPLVALPETHTRALKAIHWPTNR